MWKKAAIAFGSIALVVALMASQNPSDAGDPKECIAHIDSSSKIEYIWVAPSSVPAHFANHGDYYADPALCDS